MQPLKEAMKNVLIYYWKQEVTSISQTKYVDFLGVLLCQFTGTCGSETVQINKASKLKINIHLPYNCNCVILCSGSSLVHKVGRSYIRLSFLVVLSSVVIICLFILHKSFSTVCPLKHTCKYTPQVPSNSNVKQSITLKQQEYK